MSLLASISMLAVPGLPASGATNIPDAVQEPPIPIHLPVRPHDKTIDEGYLDAVRYWDVADQDSLDCLLCETPEALAAKVPKRENPRLLVAMYHNIVFGRTGNGYNRDLYNFEHDLIYLRRTTTIIGIEELIDIKSGRRKPDTDVSIITFDDADLSVYAILFPLLKRFDIKATVFVVSDFVGQTGYASWEQLTEMASYRNSRKEKLVTLGSHTVTHARLGEVSPGEIRRQIVDSKFIIERRTGQPVWFLALPYGSGAGRAELVETAGFAGYQGVRTSDMKAVGVDGIDMYRIPGIYIDNASSDVVTANLTSLMGR